jgi:hypothetical protein
LDEPNQKVESPNKAIDCIGSLPSHLESKFATL